MMESIPPAFWAVNVTNNDMMQVQRSLLEYRQFKDYTESHDNTGSAFALGR